MIAGGRVCENSASPDATKIQEKKLEPVENNLLPLFIVFGLLHLRPFKLKVILNLRDAHVSDILESPSSYIELPLVHLNRVGNHNKAWGRHRQAPWTYQSATPSNPKHDHSTIPSCLSKRSFEVGDAAA